MPLPELQMPNIAGALASGYQMGTAIRQQQNRRAAGKLAASGDYAGATSLALKSGDLELAGNLAQLTEQQRKVAQEHMQELGRAAYMVKNAPPQEKQAAFTWALGQAKSLGIPDDKIQGFLQGVDINDPSSIDQAVSRIITQVSSFEQLVSQGEKALDRADTRAYRDAQLGIAGANVNINAARLDLERQKADPSYIAKAEGAKKTAAAAAKKSGMMSKAKAAMDAADAQQEIVSQKIDEALQLSNAWGTTGLGNQIAGWMGGTQAHDLNQIVATIKANVGFDKLQEMRANSPTGGALGAVSENENRLLQSVFGSLEASQSKEQFQAHLTRLKTIIAQAKARRRQAFETDFKGVTPGEDVGSLDEIPEGSHFIDNETGKEYMMQDGQAVPME